MDNTLRLEKLQEESQALLRGFQEAGTSRRKPMKRTPSYTDIPSVKIGECTFEFQKRTNKGGSARGLFRCNHCDREREFAYIPRQQKAA